MKSKEIILSFGFFIILTAIFFYKVFLNGYVPVPGDLLVSEYNPWKTYSYLGYNPGSFPSKVQYFDVLRQLYPWKTLSLDIIKHGEFPLWNPYNFSGAPLLANFQSAVFYPINLLYFFLPQITAWTILVMLQPLLSAFFMYLFVRKLGMGIWGSLLASVSFAYSSFMTVWLEYNTVNQVILWFPLVLLSIEHLRVKKTVFWILICIFSLASAVFAGHIQIFIYLFIFCAVYCFFRIKRERGSITFFLFLFLLPIGIGAIQLTAGIELILNSARSSLPYDFLIHKILIQPKQLIMLFVPDFFGNPATHNYLLLDTYVGKTTSIGITALFFVFLTLIRKKTVLTRFFIATAALLLLFTTLNPITMLIYKIDIPFFSTSAPTNALFIFCFSLSVLAGFGVDIYLQEKMDLKKFFTWVVPLVFIFIILWIGVGVFPKVSVVTIRNLFYTTIILGISILLLIIGFKNRKILPIVFIFLLITHTANAWRAFEKFNPFVPSQLVFPANDIFRFLKDRAEIDRFWGYGSGEIGANFAAQSAIFSPDGYDPLYPKRYGQFIQSAKSGIIGAEATGETRSDAVVQAGFGKEYLSSNEYRLKVLDVLGVKYFLDRVENGSTEETFPENRFRLIYEKAGWKVFENLKVAPRVFLASNYQVFNTSGDFEKKFFNKELDPSKTILLEQAPFQINNLSGGIVKLVSYTPNKVVISTKTDKEGLLFLSDTYYPGWKAFIDGKETEIYRADYTFRSVAVSKGQHEVVFVFKPLSFQLGFSITILSLASLLFIIPFTIKKGWRVI